MRSPYKNLNPRIGVLLRQGGASVRLYNRLNPRFGRWGLNRLRRQHPDLLVLPGFGPVLLQEWNLLLSRRPIRDAAPGSAGFPVSAIGN